jgi:chromatin structure-remodeling complex subunit SFH1
MDREMAGARSSGTNTPRIESPAPSRPGRTTTVTLSGRRAGRVNYAEHEDTEDEEESSEEEIEEAASDPDDMTFGDRRRRRDPLLEREQQNRIVRIKRKQTEMERGWTWLGDRAPAERVRSAIALVAKHKP